MRDGKRTGESCGLRFYTTEVPINHTVDLQIIMTGSGFELEIAKKR